MSGEEHRRGITRRSLLVGGGAGVGLVLAWALWPREYRPNIIPAEGEALFGAYLRIARDGRVIVAVPQAEIGQGVWTSLPQILADELGADWRTVAVEPAPVNPIYANRLLAGELGVAGLPGAVEGVGRWAAEEYATRSALMITGGSTSIRAFEPRLREAGAAARALLSKAAAERWNADWEELDTREGFVWRGAERIPFADLAEAAAGHELPDNLPVRGGIDHRLTGQAVPRLDVPSKVDGSAQFAGDIRLPGMVYAAVRGAPAGTRLDGFEREEASRLPGVLMLFDNPAWVGAAAVNWWAAARAVEAMRPRFTGPEILPDGRTIGEALAAALESGGGSRVVAEGDVRAVFDGAQVLRARYSVGAAPGAAIETLTATARWEQDRLEIWAPTQAPGLARAAAARAAGIAEDRVTIHPTLIGGGYGRKLETEAVAQASVMAVQLGRPVQLVWPRIADIAQDRVRPPAIGAMNAALAPNGTIAAWQARIASPRTTAATIARLGASRPIGGVDPAEVAGAVPPYAIPNLVVDHHPAEIGIETGIWRSGAHSYTCFFTECFLDELARQANVEPLSFRMQMLGANPRLARVLSTAAAAAGWDGGAPGGGLGIAAHSAFGSHIALVAEVEVTGEQRVRMVRAVAVADCGRIVNPDIVRQQIEGGILHGISAAAGTPLDFAGGVPTARTIADLGLPTLADTPDITIELIESDEDPGGVTELAVPPVAPAMANALYSLTGTRLRDLPLVIGGPS
ncbi:MAG: molybdopterin cofactor-binding domain-containing protein [Allosphingosinicella sp.]|uniref:xanthine dehydrogenase family protein molybdopterin-binding subunit n=1 Tax=Allosphingosinicella sp. TaxID=2823234 RepID=UPI00394E7EEF